MTDRPATGNRAGIFLGYGMRPFFLSAGLYAVAAMLVWVGWLALHAMNGMVVQPTSSFPAMLWHGHEMVFGYALAVIAGFLLTAVPSWTGSPILPRPRLMLLFAVWAAGRLLVCFGAALPGAAVAAVDIAFPLVLAAMVAGPLWKRRAARNYLFVGVLGAFAVANGLVHGEVIGVFEDTARTGLVLGIDTILFLMIVVGGRIVPAFTSGALRQECVTLRSSGAIDAIAIACVLALLVTDLVAPETQASGIVALGAGTAQLVRMVGWRTWWTRGKPILWVLHLGYGWIVASLFLKGAAEAFGWLSPAAALHGLTIGAIGTMTLGVMSRAALGHTGRAIVAAPALATAYALVSAAALTRMFGPTLLPDWYSGAMIVSGSLWIVAFGVFAALFWPVLTRPRIDGRPG